MIMREKALADMRAYTNAFNYMSEVRTKIQKTDNVDELIDIRLELSKYGSPAPELVDRMIKMIDKKLTKLQDVS